MSDKTTFIASVILGVVFWIVGMVSNNDVIMFSGLIILNIWAATAMIIGSLDNGKRE